MHRILLLSLCLAAFSAPLFSQIFKGESVEYDPTGNRFLTSADATSIVQRAADGSISYFGTGLKASYGMEIMNETLFALDGSTIFAYDLATATQKAAIAIAGASFLNGLASDGSHRLWATDFSAKKIFEIDVTDLAQPIVSTLVLSFGGQPNGAVFDEKNNRLVVVSWGTSAAIKAVDLATKTLSTLTTTTLGNIDGIDMDSTGNFYTASWTPAKITRWLPDFSSSQSITVAGLNKPADLCFANEIDTLAIPNTGGNNILFIGFSTVSSENELKTNGFQLKISPNPISENSFVEFVLPTSGLVSCQIFDEMGHLVFSLVDEFYSVGEHRILLQNLDLKPGFYSLKLAANGETKATTFVK